MTPDEIKAEQARLARPFALHRALVAGVGRGRGAVDLVYTHEEREEARARSAARAEQREERRAARKARKARAKRSTAPEKPTPPGAAGRLRLVVEGQPPKAAGDRFEARVEGSPVLRIYRYRPEIHELAP